MLYSDENYIVDENGSLLISANKVKGIYGITQTSLNRYYKQGLPKAKHGWLELVSTIQWFTNSKNADGGDNFTEVDKLNADVKRKIFLVLVLTWEIF